MTQLDQSLLPLRDYHKSKKLLWDPQELSLDQDKQDWAAMTADQQALIRRALALFMGGEIAVTHDLSPLLIALKREGGHLEEEMYLTTQLFEESKHVEFFDRIVSEVLNEQDVQMDAGPNYTGLFSALTEALDTLLTDNSLAAQAMAVSAYHMIIEGVLAETAYYGFFTALRKRNLMPGLTRGLELVQRDEARHIAFGLYLLDRLITADPSLWLSVEGQINRLLPLAQGVFMEVLMDFLPNIPFELDLNDLMAYASKQYMARMGALERTRERAVV